MNNLAQIDIFKILLSFGKEVLYFPLWWYTGGSKTYWRWAWGRVRRVEDIIAFSVMLKNIYRPLYGDYSVIGVIIGPIIRVFWFVFIGPCMLLTFLFFCVLFIFYLVLPPFALIMLLGIYQLF